MDIVAMVLAVLAAIFFFGALANLSPDASWRHVLVRGIFSSRSQFTQRGWRYRNMAIALAVAALVIFAGLLFGA